MAKKTSRTTPEVAAVAFDRRIVVAVGDKGQTGKSTVELQLVDWCLQLKSRPVMRLFDPDTKHMTLWRVFGPNGSCPIQPPHAIEQVDWRGPGEEVAIDRIVESLYDEVDEPAVLSIVDGVANQAGDITRWATKARVFEMGREHGFRLTFLVLMDETNDSVLSSRKLFDVVGDHADYVIVRNTKKLSCLPWDGCEDRAHVLDRLGAVEITLPKFTLDVQQYTDGQLDNKPHSLRQAAADAPRQFVRQRAVNEMDNIFKEFDRVAELLVPPQVLQT